MFGGQEKVAFSAEGNLLTDWVLNDVVGATTWTYPRGSVTMEEYLEIVATIPARRVWNQSFLSLSHVNFDMSVFVDSSPNGLTVNTSPVGGSAGSADGCIRCRKLIVARSASRSRER